MKKKFQRLGLLAAFVGSLFFWNSWRKALLVGVIYTALFFAGEAVRRHQRQRQ